MKDEIEGEESEEDDDNDQNVGVDAESGQLQGEKGVLAERKKDALKPSNREEKVISKNNATKQAITIW
jgi:hypothetical protein